MGLTGTGLIWTIFNLVLLVAGLAGFVLLVFVLLKLNKALNIWLEEKKK